MSNYENDPVECTYCGWGSYMPESHIIHCIDCPEIQSKYHVWIDDDGEIEFMEKRNGEEIQFQYFWDDGTECTQEDYLNFKREEEEYLNSS